MKRNVPQRGQTFDVAETDIFVTNVAEDSGFVAGIGDPGAAITARGYDTRFHWFVENLKHAFTGSASGLHKLIQLMQTADRIIEERRQHEKRNEITQLHRTRQHSVTAEGHHEQRTDRFEHRHRWAVDRPYAHHNERSVAQLIAYSVKARVFFPLANETLNLPDAGEIIVQQRVHGRRGASLQSITPVRGERVSERAGNQQWKRSQREQCQLDIQIKHHTDDDQHL